MNNPEVSVILPVYNGQRYLCESLDSVLLQDYKNFEFLICDDGSSDNSQKIINSKQDSRIRFFKNNSNQGLFETLNKLILESKSRYLRLWSQDDIMKPNCLHEEVLFFKKYSEIAFSYCARDVINGKGEIVKKAPLDRTPELISPQLAAQIMFYHGSITGNISTVMIKKQIVEELGFFRQDMRVAGDFEMWVRIAKKYPIGFIRKPLIKLRVHKEQFSRRKGSDVHFDKENPEIFSELKKRLPQSIRSYAKKYVHWYGDIYNFHCFMKSLLFFNFKKAKVVYKKINNPIKIFFIWLLTVNGHFFKKKPKLYLGSKTANRGDK